MGALWHPFSDMGAVERDGEFFIARGEGAYVFDPAGTRYLDATAGLWFPTSGTAGRSSVRRQRCRWRRSRRSSTFGDYVTEPTVELAERHAQPAPLPGSKVFFTSGGSDSVDTAAKLARRYWNEVGKPSKRVLVGRQKASTACTTRARHWPASPVTARYGDLVTDTAAVAGRRRRPARHLRAGRAGQRRRLLRAGDRCRWRSPSAGRLPPTSARRHRVRRAACRRRGGDRLRPDRRPWFASTQFGLEPDLVTTAKGLDVADHRWAPC